MDEEFKTNIGLSTCGGSLWELFIKIRELINIMDSKYDKYFFQNHLHSKSKHLNV